MTLYEMLRSIHSSSKRPDVYCMSAAEYDELKQDLFENQTTHAWGDGELRAKSMIVAGVKVVPFKEGGTW